jgi:hypothetical protein
MSHHSSNYGGDSKRTKIHGEAALDLHSDTQSKDGIAPKYTSLVSSCTDYKYSSQDSKLHLEEDCEISYDLLAQELTHLSQFWHEDLVLCKLSLLIQFEMIITIDLDSGLQREMAAIRFEKILQDQVSVAQMILIRVINI